MGENKRANRNVRRGSVLVWGALLVSQFSNIFHLKDALDMATGTTNTTKRETQTQTGEKIGVTEAITLIFGHRDTPLGENLKY